MSNSTLKNGKKNKIKCHNSNFIWYLYLLRVIKKDII